jgi:hypothetical protein
VVADGAGADRAAWLSLLVALAGYTCEVMWLPARWITRHRPIRKSG